MTICDELEARLKQSEQDGERLMAAMVAEPCASDEAHPWPPGRKRFEKQSGPTVDRVRRPLWKAAGLPD